MSLPPLPKLWLTVNDSVWNVILKHCNENTHGIQKMKEFFYDVRPLFQLYILKVHRLKSTRGWRNTHWPRRHLFSSYEAAILDQMASLPLGLTWVWINIPDSYLTFIKHVIGSGPWLIWAHQFVLSYREVRTISLFTHMGIFICLWGWEHRQNEPPLSKARWGIWRHLLMVTPVFAFALSILIHTNKNTARGIPFSYACNENNHGKHHKLLKS